MTSGKSGSKVNRAWLHEHVNDPYVKMAQKDGYRTRAAYKLKEIDEALQLLKPGQLVVDLGAAPGAWSQYVQRKLSTRRKGETQSAGRTGRLIALDLLPMDPIEGVEFIQGDICSEEVLTELTERLHGQQLDLVLSDMAPNLSGVAVTDAARIELLIELALDFAAQHLKPDGALVAKVFHGAAYEALFKRFSKAFRVVKRIKPKASRGRSAETFLVGQGLRTG